MEANELRIGNKVIYSNSNTMYTVIGIHEYGIDVEDEMETTYMEYDCFQPIPLTEEILLKCGFVKRGDFWFDNDKLTIDKCSYDDVINVRYRLNAEESIFICELKHLHQLQNLYWCLTNEELNINL